MEVFQVKLEYEKLKQSIENLVEALPSAVDGFVAVSPGQFSYGSEAIKMASEGYSELFYVEGIRDGRHTKVWIGALGVSAEIIELAKKVNNRKDRFREAVIAVREATQASKKKCGPHGAMKKFRRDLSDTDIGLKSLSLRQAYRHIPILEESPFSIRFSMSGGGRSIKKVKVSEATKMLDKLDLEGKDTTKPRKILNKYNENHVLAQVQSLAPYFKANIRLKGPRGEKKFLTMPAFLPLLYLADGGERPRIPSSLSEVNPQKKPPRNDKKIAEKPLIDTLRLHLYVKVNQ